MDRDDALRVLGEVAADQWGLVTTRQAEAAGVSRVNLARLADIDLVESVSRGVYRVSGSASTSHLEIKVAWLRLDPGVPAWRRAVGDGLSGVVSHASACELHDLGDIPADEVHISVPRRRTTRELAVRLHLLAHEPGDVTVVDGLPVTTVDRTICDLLATRADAGHVGRVLVDADRRGLTDTRVLADRVQPFARAYGLRNADGGELLEHLAEQTGSLLRDQQLTTAGERAIESERHLRLDPTETYRNLALVNAGWRNAMREIAGPLEEIHEAMAPIAELAEMLSKLVLPGVAYQKAMQQAQVPYIRYWEALREIGAPSVELQRAIAEATRPTIPTSDAVRKALRAGPVRPTTPLSKSLNDAITAAVEGRLDDAGDDEDTSEPSETADTER
ncbi:type IV toxin-antitoxin system AbiEi family antitoxin domain-containing protein [Embleya sp. NPDC020630]|uniref:type IV toxin-antitoxin system AbiEi family antitoxin domain-containing protein n=1 Tax=Embleya sp. NPDC020630 TaxID=3363979 RepID=UPI0037A646D6